MKHDYVCAQLFNEEECAELVTAIANNVDDRIKDVPAEDVHKNATVFMARYKPLRKLMHKAEQFVLDVNKSYFGYDLFSTTDHDIISLNGYNVDQNGVYGWHKDITDDINNFDYKLTMLINVSSDYYEGGTFCYFTTGAERTVEEFSVPGSICVIPSFVPHTVRKVTLGQRKSITQFYSGPRFR